MHCHRFALIGLCLLFVVGCSGHYHVRPVQDESWQSGTIGIAPNFENSDMGARATGSWPNANDDLFLCLCIAVQQGDSSPIPILGQGPLSLRKFKSSGVFYQGMTRTDFDQTKPHRLVLDYEIWKGKPTSGKLLTKQTLKTEAFDPAEHASTSKHVSAAD